MGFVTFNLVNVISEKEKLTYILHFNLYILFSSSIFLVTLQYGQKLRIVKLHMSRIARKKITYIFSIVIVVANSEKYLL